jgi:hypothetical protein
MDGCMRYRCGTAPAVRRTKGQAMTIATFKYSQGSALGASGIESEGVCLELCRRWVKAKLSNGWKEGDTIYEWTDKSLPDVVKKHEEAGTLKDREITGLNNETAARRSGGGLLKAFQGLRSRADVIKTVLELHGVFIYCAIGKGKDASGHAFAFDTRNPKSVSFFDPNQGEWVFTNEESDNIKTWWWKFWEGSGGLGHGQMNYKSEFHKGDTRWLERYTISPQVSESPLFPSSGPSLDLGIATNQSCEILE